MRIPSPALLPAAWLALTGAAPPPDSSLQSLTECRLDYDHAMETAAALPVSLSTESMSPGDDPSQLLSRSIVVPADLKVFGFTPSRIVVTEMVPADGVHRLSILSVVHAPYPDVERSLLAGHKIAQCTDRTSGSRECLAISNYGAKWHMGLLVRESDKGILIDCMFILTSDQ